MAIGMSATTAEEAPRVREIPNDAATPSESALALAERLAKVDPTARLRIRSEIWAAAYDLLTIEVKCKSTVVRRSTSGIVGGVADNAKKARGKVIAG